MPSLILAAALLVVCSPGGPGGGVARAASAPPPGRLHVDGRAFRTPAGDRFAWRGLTAFRLVEMSAQGRAAEAEAYLDWAASHGVTVVRVLAMASRLFDLRPAAGRAALPAVLAAAGARGLVVEVVALADTDRLDVDLQAQVASVGEACARFDNCVLELANEPWVAHAQRPGLGEPALLARLRTLVPPRVPVAYGAAARDDSPLLAGGDYVTVHLSRAGGARGWQHVLRMRAAESLSRQTGKPVVDDEPIGAGEVAQAGRRDPDAARWFAKGVLARLLGLGATFHYEGGLQARVPAGREAACFDAWRDGLEALPADLEDRARIVEVGSPGSAVASFDESSALAVIAAQADDAAWAAVLGARGRTSVRWRAGWREVTSLDRGEARLLKAVRQASAAQ